MSWVDLVPLTKRSGGMALSAAAVTLSVSPPGRLVSRAFLTVKPALLPQLAWWAHGAAVSVQQGEGEHAGRVRVRPGGPFRIMPPIKRASASKPNAPMLQMVLAGSPAGGMKRVAVAWEVLGEALVVSLPWSGVRGATKAEPTPVAPVPAMAKPAPTAVPQPGPVLQEERKKKSLAAAEMAVMGKVLARGRGMSLGELTARETGLLRRLEEARLTEYVHGSGWTVTAAGQCLLRDTAGLPPHLQPPPASGARHLASEP